MKNEKIHSGMIQEALQNRFANYDFLLANTFVFAQGWESDFFARSKSGYFVEVEIKISRSDYFKDFEKEKHDLFKSMIIGKSHHIRKRHTFYHRGDLLGRFMKKRLVDTRYRWNEKELPEGVLPGKKNGKDGYWTNQDHYQLRDDWWQEVHAPATGIEFMDLSKEKLPHQFYFCCPKSMISLSEVPKYAGLLEYSRNGIVIAKKAPYLHKRKVEMYSTLAWKFYWLWRNRAHSGRNIQNQSIIQ